jgi:hypothetical protein
VIEDCAVVNNAAGCGTVTAIVGNFVPVESETMTETVPAEMAEIFNTDWLMMALTKPNESVTTVYGATPPVTG